MEAIFGSSQATGRFAMGSNEALGVPTELGQIDVDARTKTVDLEGNEADSEKGVQGSKTNDDKDKEGKTGKRNRLSEKEMELMIGLTEAVTSVVDALKAPQHNEVHQDLYGCVMSCPGYTQEALMYALIYLLENKAEGLCFVQMTEEHRILWLRTYLSTTYFTT